MTKLGLLSPESRKLYLAYLAARRGWGRNVVYFSDNRERAIQSFNRKTEEIYEMAQKVKKAIASAPSRKAEFVWKGFVNVNLTSEQKAAYQTWDVQDDDVWDGISTYCAAGYKISLSFNKANDKFNCTGTGQPDTGSNNGYAVSAFANSPYEAARVWLFKVSTILPDDWSLYSNGEADDIG